MRKLFHAHGNFDPTEEVIIDVDDVVMMVTQDGLGHHYWIIQLRSGGKVALTVKNGEKLRAMLIDRAAEAS